VELILNAAGKGVRRSCSNSSHSCDDTIPCSCKRKNRIKEMREWERSYGMLLSEALVRLVYLVIVIESEVLSSEAVGERKRIWIWSRTFGVPHIFSALLEMLSLSATLLPSLSSPHAVALAVSVSVSVWGHTVVVVHYSSRVN